MRERAILVLQDEQPTFVLLDGSIIDTDKIGYIAHNYGEHPEDSFYDRFTKEDVSFIQDNKIECEIEMVYDSDEDGHHAESEKIPKLYKGKVIIHFK
jgi:hypothetical protein